jgi:hypothetical protein
LQVGMGSIHHQASMKSVVVFELGV